MNQSTKSTPTVEELARLVQEQQHQLAALQQWVDRPAKLPRFHFPWLRRPSLMSFALVGLLIAVSGLASASIPAASGVITGCYTTATSALRLIDAEAGQICSKGERLVSWNQVGPQGLPGTSGVSGYEIVSAGSFFDSSTTKTTSVFCPAGKSVLGGGAVILPTAYDPNWESAPITVRDSGPSGRNSWFARGIEIVPYGFNWYILAHAICANVTTTAAATASETATDVVVTDPPALAEGDTGAVPVTVTEPVTATVDANTIFLPFVTH